VSPIEFLGAATVPLLGPVAVAGDAGALTRVAGIKLGFLAAELAREV
jgi:hypothetical protein